MRRGFNTLAEQAEKVLELDPYTGHLFVFRGRRGDLLKIIWWDQQGACLFSKRLEKRYRFGVRSESMDQLNLTFEEDEEIAEAADEQAKSARRARRAAPIAIKADLRWSRSVATRAAAQDLWQVSTGPGHPLHFWPDAEGAAILEPRPFGT